MVKVSIIIVSYNGRDHLSRCLAALYTCDQQIPFEAVVVDNASRDGSLAMLARDFPQVRAIASKRNDGFAKGCNLGARAALGEYLLFLNSDTEVLSDALQTLTAFLDEHAHAAVVTSRLVYPDLTDQGVARSFPGPINAIFGRRTLVTRLLPGNRFSRKYLLSRVHPSDRPFEVDWVSGACLMVRAHVFRELGGFDEGFFMYWEDADLCFRIKQRGWKVFAVPAAVVIHYEGGSSAQNARLVIAFHRSVYRYYRKHHIRSSISPAILLAAAGLAARASLLLGGNMVRRALSARKPKIAAPRHVFDAAPRLR